MFCPSVCRGEGLADPVMRLELRIHGCSWTRWILLSLVESLTGFNPEIAADLAAQTAGSACDRWRAVARVPASGLPAGIRTTFVQAMGAMDRCLGPSSMYSRLRELSCPLADVVVGLGGQGLAAVIDRDVGRPAAFPLRPR